MTRALWAFILAIGCSQTAGAVPLQTIGTFCSTFPAQCQKGTMSLLAARGIGTDVEYIVEVDPATGALPVNVTGGSFTVSIASDGPTGDPVPADANYLGLNNGGIMIGAVGDSSGRQIVVGPGTAGTPTGGLLSVQGAASMTPLLVNGSGSTQPVSGTVTANQGGAPWTMTGTGTAGTAASGVLTVQGITSMTPLLVNGSGSTQPVSGTVAVSNFPATVDTNTGAAGASTLRTVISSRSEAATTPLAVRLTDGSSFYAGATETTLSSLNGKVANNYGAASGAVRTAAQIGNATAVADFGAGASSAQTLRVVNVSDATPPVGRSYADSVRYAYTSGAVGTSSWVQMIASTAAAMNCIQIFDSSGQTLELGTGAAASETRVMIIPPGGIDGCAPLRIASGTRISLRALSATTGTVGEFDLTGLQ